MTLDQILERSDALHFAITDLLCDALTFPGRRHEAAMTVCGIAFEHATALRILFHGNCPTTAVAVLRLQFEALTRGMWLLYAASEREVEMMTNPLTVDSEKTANKLPMVGKLLEAIVEKAPKEASNMLVQFKEISWRSMNSFVHCGIHPLGRHANGYPLPMIVDVLRSSNGLNTMTGILAAILTGDERYMQPMRKLQKAYSDCLPPMIATE